MTPKDPVNLGQRKGQLVLHVPLLRRGLADVIQKAFFHILHLESLLEVLPGAADSPAHELESCHDLVVHRFKVILVVHREPFGKAKT